MVDLSGDKAERFNVITELLELFDLDVADAIDASVYILEGANADAWSLEDTLECELADAKEELYEAAKRAHPAWQAVDTFSREMDYSALSDGHYDEQIDDEPEAVWVLDNDYIDSRDIPDFTLGAVAHAGYWQLTASDIAKLGEFKPVSA